MSGKFFGIECKAGKNKPTALQEKNLREITMAGGRALVVNEENVKMVTVLLQAARVSDFQGLKVNLELDI